MVGWLAGKMAPGSYCSSAVPCRRYQPGEAGRIEPLDSGKSNAAMLPEGGLASSISNGTTDLLGHRAGRSLSEY